MFKRQQLGELEQNGLIQNAEAAAINRGLQLASEMDVQKITVESDSCSVIARLRSSCDNLSDVGIILDDVCGVRMEYGILSES